jgi:hypothetical protein
MIVISEDKKNELKSTKYKVYSLSPMSEGVECFGSSKQFASTDKFYITAVNANHIKYESGKFYYTNEDLSDVADWWPAHILPTSKNFKKCKEPKIKCATKVGDDVGRKIDGYGCLVDVSGLPAFNGVNEDITVSEYRFYLTLFNEYTVKQLRYERHDLFDAKFESSKFDLAAKMQSADFLKPKDFKMINYKRKDTETVNVGIVLKESSDKYSMEYGIVFIDMNNMISVRWH